MKAELGPSLLSLFHLPSFLSPSLSPSLPLFLPPLSPKTPLHVDSTHQANLHTSLTSLKGVSYYKEGKKEKKNPWQTLPGSFLCIHGSLHLMLVAAL